MGALLFQECKFFDHWKYNFETLWAKKISVYKIFYSWNSESEVETTWISLMGWPQKTSSAPGSIEIVCYLKVPGQQVLVHNKFSLFQLKPH